MATRTIETPKDRLVTILVAPLMSCSARLPVYTLLIGACMPGGVCTAKFDDVEHVFAGHRGGAGRWRGFSRKRCCKGETPMLVMELPPYRRPAAARIVLRHTWDRAKIFLRRAGTVILGINILLWFLASYPQPSRGRTGFRRPTRRRANRLQPDARRPEQQSRRAGAIGRGRRRGTCAAAALPATPAGCWNRPSRRWDFDWKMGIGILSSFAAREVFVSTMSIVYNVAEGRG